MAIFYIDGGTSENKTSGAILGLESNANTFRSVTHGDTQTESTRAVISSHVTSITQSASSNIAGVQNVDGYFGFTLASSASAGTTVSITGADYPLNGVHHVTSASGNLAVTSTPWTLCSPLTSSGVYTVNTTDIDPAAQRDTLIKGYTTNLAGSANTALRNVGGRLEDRRSVNSFTSYTQRLHVSGGWATFDGSLNPCQLSVSGVTLASDDAASGTPTVVFDVGGNVQAADLENPDLTGLRDPS
jgi:hypothetical protein